MPATTNVKVVVDAKDNASGVLRGLSSEFKKLGKSSENVANDFRTLGKVALAGAAGLVALGVKAGMSAARITELGFALTAIAKANNISQEAVDETVNSLRDMNIANAKALQITSLFIQSQLDLADATRVATAAKDLAIIAGLDSSEATETLTRAIIMQRPMLLKQFGIIAGLDQIYNKYAETINKSASELTELEKRQAFLNEILLAGEKVAGTYDAAMDSVSKRFRSLTGRIIPDFIAEIGKAFEPTLIVIIDTVSNAIKEMGKWIKENKDTLEIWGKKLGDVTAKGIILFGKFFKFIIDHKEIILGVLVAFGVGIGVLVVTFLIAHAAIIGIFIAIVAWVAIFANAWKGSFEKAKKAVNEFWESVRDRFDKVKEKVESVINFIKNLIENFKPKIKINIDLPDIGKAWENLKTKARDIGIPGFQTGGIVSGPIGTPIPAIVHAGERIIPAGVQASGGGAGGSIALHVNIGLYAGTETEKRNIAQVLYNSLVQLAQSQNKNVAEFMGG